MENGRKNFLHADKRSKGQRNPRPRQEKEPMEPTCFFEISVLFLIWIMTVAAFLIYIRREKKMAAEGKKVGNRDLLLGLFSQKAKEAKIAVERLSRVADELGIGLIESVPGRIVLANKWAKRFCPVEAEDPDELGSFLRQRSFPCTIRRGERIIELRRLEAANRLILVLQDVTEGYRLARQVKEKERLALLGQMSAQMAHQIKTPLSVLAGRAQMLARRLPVGSRERDQAEAFFEESRGLARQVNQIVDFYKEPEPEYSNIPVKDILRATADKLGSMDTGCTIRIDAPDGLEITTDTRLLSNALFLVAQNSMSPEVGADLVEIRAQEMPDGLSITIRDNGTGFERDLLQQMFDPFFTTKQEGLGLGLFIAKDILSRIGCRIKPVFTNGAGAEFEIVVPVRTQYGISIVREKGTDEDG